MSTAQANDTCCGHSHGAPANETGAAKGEPEEEVEFDGDLTRSACCLRDQEDYERAQVLLKKLRAVDPTRIAVDQRKQVVLDTLKDSTYSEYLREVRQADQAKRCEANAAHVASQPQPEKSAESDTDTDDSFVDSEDEEMLQRMAQLRMGTTATTAQECESEAELLKILAAGGKVICLLHAALEDPLSMSVLQKLKRLEQRYPSLRFVYMRMSDLGRQPHPLVQAVFKQGDVSHRPPILMAFDAGLESVGGLLAKNLERMGTLETWIETLEFKSNGSTAVAEDEDESGEEFEDDGAFRCEKEGCSRRFFHKHVQRLNKAAEDDG